jgi:hypothetical protein
VLDSIMTSDAICTYMCRWHTHTCKNLNVNSRVLWTLYTTILREILWKSTHRNQTSYAIIPVVKGKLT